MEKPPLPLTQVSVSPVAKASGEGVVWEGSPKEVTFRLQSGVKRGDSQARWDEVGGMRQQCWGMRKCPRHLGLHLKNRVRKMWLGRGKSPWKQASGASQCPPHLHRYHGHLYCQEPTHALYSSPLCTKHFMCMIPFQPQSFEDKV